MFPKLFLLPWLIKNVVRGFSLVPILSRLSFVIASPDLSERGPRREGILSFTIEMVNDGRLSGRDNPID